MHTLHSLDIDLLRKQAGWVSKLQVTSELWASLVIFMLNKKLNISWRGKFIISQHVTQVFLWRWYIEVPFTVDFLSFFTSVLKQQNTCYSLVNILTDWRTNSPGQAQERWLQLVSLEMHCVAKVSLKNSWYSEFWSGIVHEMEESVRETESSRSITVQSF